MIINMTGGGGGAALNFKVVPGLTQPGTASENTIWVKTEKIGAWYFSATQPEGMQEWDVWFQTGTESGVEFNALRKNAVQVYPLSAKQMVSGELVDVEAMSYQNGDWVNWVVILLDGSNQFEAITGGWVQDPNLTIGSYPNTGTVTFNDDGITVSSTNSAYTVVRTKNAIDMSNFSKLTASAKAIQTVSNISVRIFIITSATGDVEASDVAILQNITSTVFTDYDLPFNLDGTYYIALVVSSSRSGTVKKIRLS